MQFCSRQDSVNLKCKDAFTSESSFRNVSNSRRDQAVKRKCSRCISFADQSGGGRQSNSQKVVAVEHGSVQVEPDLDSLAAGGHTRCSRHCCGCNGRNCSAYVGEIGHETFLAINACAANTNETARPSASLNNNNARFGFNTVYCRCIFTNDDDDETL